jgi:hypothetical protein
VVGDVRSTALTEEFPSLYYPMASRVWPLMDIVVRTDGSPAPEALLPAIREKVRELDSELALANVRTMEQWLSNSAAQPRLNTVMLSVFAFVALLIASLGIYGVLAYSVSQRTGEIGVRMALGATPRDALRLIIREGMTGVVIGVGAGLLGGLALGLRGVEPGVRRAGTRPGSIHRRGSYAGSCGAGSMCDSRAARVTSGPDRSAALRMSSGLSGRVDKLASGNRNRSTGDAAGGSGGTLACWCAAVLLEQNVSRGICGACALGFSSQRALFLWGPQTAR